MSESPPYKKFKTDEEDDAHDSADNSVLEPDNSPCEDTEPETAQDHAEDAEENNKNDEHSSPTNETATDEKSDASKVGASTVPHCDIIAEHYNARRDKGFAERGDSRIYYMRNFNNWIKSGLISQFMKRIKQSRENQDIYVLDMGCGKGGDMFKWKDAGVKHVVFADIAEISIQHCKQRYNDLRKKLERQRRGPSIFTAEFIAADCTRARLRDLYSDPSIRFDIVSCQFAFHYCWESLPQAECMLKNASECLREGGFFVGTCPDSTTIMSRLRKAGGKEFGNSVYSIKFEHEYPEGVTPPLFGTKYNFHLEDVVDCPEFLVHFPTFRELAQRWGFMIYHKQPFHSFYKDRIKDEKLADLLSKMSALEAYQPNETEKLVASEDEYSHVRNTSASCVGTLSRSEWEAITLYLTFAFKKIKEPEPEL